MVALRWTQQESCQLTSLNLNSTFSLEGVESVKLLVDACRGAPNNGFLLFQLSLWIMANQTTPKHILTQTVFRRARPPLADGARFNTVPE
jgi:hypothetical protein